MNLPSLCGLAAAIGKPIYVIDLETTGFKQPGVVEIACLKATTQGKVIYKSTLVNPERSIEPGARAVHGISQWQVAKEKTLREYLDFLAEVARLGVYSGFGIVNYDLRVIHDNAIRYGHQGIPSSTALDLRDIWKRISGSSKGKLVELAAHYAVEVKDAHRALGDTLMTAQILDIIIAKHGQEFVLQSLRKVGS